jgi:hypothetical protein
MDNALRKLTGMEKIPSTSTVGDWLRRQGNSLGINALKKVIDITTRKALSMDKRKEYTLDKCQPSQALYSYQTSFLPLFLRLLLKGFPLYRSFNFNLSL